MQQDEQDGAPTRLARLLLERGLRHNDVCRRSGVSRQTLSNAVNGRTVSLDTWIRLAVALGVAVADIAPRGDAARIAAVV